MQHQSEQSTRIIREVIIREQLIKMFPDVEMIDILFCAHELAMQLHDFRIDPHYGGGKC